GSDTLAHYQQVLDSVTFANTTNDNPTNFGANPTRTISWVANDGTADSNTGSTTINVTAVNDAPVVANAGNTVSYTQGGAATTVDSGLTVTDADNQNLASATVSITGGTFFAGDTLTATT